MSEQITLEEFLALKKHVQYLTKKVKTLEKELEKKDFDETFKDFEAFVEKEKDFDETFKDFEDFEAFVEKEKDFDETFKDFEAFVEKEKADRERRAEIYHAWDDFCEPF